MLPPCSSILCLLLVCRNRIVFGYSPGRQKSAPPPHFNFFSSWFLSVSGEGLCLSRSSWDIAATSSCKAPLWFGFSVYPFYLISSCSLTNNRIHVSPAHLSVCSLLAGGAESVFSSFWALEFPTRQRCSS